MANWYSAAAQFLNGFPDNYLVFDTETTGLQIDSPSTFIAELGYAIVRDRKLVEAGAVVLDWTLGAAAVPESEYRGALDKVRRDMAAKGKPYHTDWARVRERGSEPVATLREYRDLIEDAAGSDYALVAHNGFAFDRPLLERYFRKTGNPYAINCELLVDTGLLEKCNQLQWTPPMAGSCDRKHWWHKLADARRKGVKWSLDNYCVPAYGLVEKHNLDPANAHSADYDCICTHHLLEAMRERIED